MGAAAKGSAMRISPRRVESIVQHEHVVLMKFMQQSVGRLEVADELAQRSSGGRPTSLDEVSIDDESEFERVHDVSVDMPG